MTAKLAHKKLKPLQNEKVVVDDIPPPPDYQTQAIILNT